MSLTHSSYLEMLRRGYVSEEHAALQELRISVLCDHAEQQFSKVLIAALLEQGFRPILHVADYGTAALQAFDPHSELYGSKPDFVVYSLAVQKYRDRFFASSDWRERERLPGVYLAEVLSIMDALLERKISVVVSNLALPIERMFGNYGALTQQSLYGSVLAFNNLLAEAVKTRRSCSMNDVMFIANRFGSENFFDERLWLSSKAPCAYRFLPEIARSISRIVAVNRGKAKKVLVLDLDNTIWGGVIGDDGMDGIALGGDAFGEAFQQFQKYVLGLRDRGFVLAVCSKNNEATAIEPFRSHPEMLLNETDISVFVANWNDKAGNIDYISRVLSLGRDSFIFIDDSAFERDQVANAHPMVAVPEIPEDVAGYISAIEWSGLLEAQSFTAEDATRNDSYRVEAQRTTEQLRFSDIGEYLASLEMKITAEPFGVADLPRVAQLIQRSNQFNLRTQRLSEADCESAAKLNHVTLSARLSDKFGDYGLISVVVGEPDGDSLFIKELVMSCRVLRRGVEEYLMNTLFSEAALRGFSGIKGEYIASAKNKMVEGFYRDFGFDLISDPSDLKRTVWYLATSDYAPRKTHIQRVTT